MSKIKLGGIKVFETQAYICVPGHGGRDELRDLCSTIAAGRTALGCLAHIADVGSGGSITGACAKNEESFFVYLSKRSGLAECAREKINSPVCSISIFPHDQRPEVAGLLLSILGPSGIKPLQIGSSPSAITLVVCSNDFEPLMELLFTGLDFSTCQSFKDWQETLRMDEKMLSEVCCSYNEQIITIYGITHQGGMRLCNFSLRPEEMGSLGEVFLGMNKSGVKLPFHVSMLDPEQNRMHFSLALPPDLYEKTGIPPELAIPARGCAFHEDVALLFVHGPHFGDRYGIADAFVDKLRESEVPLLALSCAVSSITAVIPGSKAGRAIEVLGTRFQTPDLKKSGGVCPIPVRKKTPVNQ